MLYGSPALPMKERMTSSAVRPAAKLEGQVAVVGEEKAVAVLLRGQQAAELGGLVALAGGRDGNLALAVEGPDALVNGAA